MFEESQKKLEELKVVPVVKLNKEEDAIPLGEALCAAGLPIAEVTFRTERRKRQSGRWWENSRR